jgi:hypothetical protein
MAAFRRNGEANEFISDLYGAPVLKAYFFGLKRINRLLKILFTDPTPVKRFRMSRRAQGPTTGSNNGGQV